MNSMIGLDFGASFTHVAVFRNRRLEKFFSVPSDKTGFRLVALFLKKPENKGEKVVLTGSRKNAAAALGGTNIVAKFAFVGELEAIGAGSRFLCGKKAGKRFVSVNVGTGTPIVLVDGKDCRHLGGTGLGGGTLSGLGKLVLNARVEKISKLARKGSNALDLTVNDVLGSRIGIIPSNATASNFGKVATRKDGRSAARENVAFSLVNLVAEAIGVISAFAASSVGCDTLVFTGRTVACDGFFKKRVGEVLRLFGKKMIAPKHAEFCTAIGAVVSAMEKECR